MFGRLIVSAAIGITCGTVVVVGSQSSSGGSAVLVTAPGNQSTAHGGPRGAFNRGMVLAISPDGRVLASGGGDKVVRLWSLPHGDRLRTLGGHRAAITNLAFTPDSKLLAASDDKTVSLWSVADGRRVATLDGHPASVRCVWVTPDGHHILTQVGGELRSWTVPDGRLETTSSFNSDRDSPSHVVFTADSRTLAIAVAAWVAQGTDLSSTRFDPIAWLGPPPKIRKIGQDRLLTPQAAFDTLSPCLVSPKTNSPSPAQRRVHASAPKANSYQFS